MERRFISFHDKAGHRGYDDDNRVDDGMCWEKYNTDQEWVCRGGWEPRDKLVTGCHHNRRAITVVYVDKHPPHIHHLPAWLYHLRRLSKYRYMENKGFASIVVVLVKTIGGIARHESDIIYTKTSAHRSQGNESGDDLSTLVRSGDKTCL